MKTQVVEFFTNYKADLKRSFIVNARMNGFIVRPASAKLVIENFVKQSLNDDCN